MSEGNGTQRHWRSRALTSFLFKYFDQALGQPPRFAPVAGIENRLPATRLPLVENYFR